MGLLRRLRIDRAIPNDIKHFEGSYERVMTYVTRSLTMGLLRRFRYTKRAMERAIPNDIKRFVGSYELPTNDLRSAVDVMTDW
ncbi:jg8592 [Pararge aegeria aegeria]|uniref:Jg8592 protein n=1 Tax=Pararge aegeria aegeria TaxID=348720 RepID=A0A8S4RL81_9NEOP|nr:jg8592 [Pararge aegeria aegeria]